MDFVKSEPGSIPIIVECFFNETPKIIFNAWTDPDIVKQWFGMEPNSMHSAFIDLRVGGEWRIIRKTTDEPNGDGTDVRLQHSALKDTQSSQNFAFGWNASMHNIFTILTPVK